MTVRNILSMCKNDIDYLNVTVVNSEGERSEIMSFPLLEYIGTEWANREVISFEIKTNEELDFTEIYFEVR